MSVPSFRVILTPHGRNRIAPSRLRIETLDPDIRSVKNTPYWNDRSFFGSSSCQKENLKGNAVLPSSDSQTSFYLLIWSKATMSNNPV